MTVFEDYDAARHALRQLRFASLAKTLRRLAPLAIVEVLVIVVDEQILFGDGIVKLMVSVLNRSGIHARGSLADAPRHTTWRTLRRGRGLQPYERPDVAESTCSPIFLPARSHRNLSTAVFTHSVIRGMRGAIHLES